MERKSIDLTKPELKLLDVRDVLNKTRRQMTKAGENICNRYDKGLLSLIYKELI